MAASGDSRAIAEIHVRAWQGAYHGILPPHVLGALSVEARASTWAARISEGASILVAEDEGSAIVGWASFGLSRDEDMECMLHPSAGHGA